MKKYLFFLFILLHCTIRAQVYHPFPQSGISWREDMNGLGFNCCCSGPQSVCLQEDKNELSLNGDTVIGTYTYSKIYRLGYFAEYLFAQSPYTCPAGCQNYDPQFYGSYYVGGLRQDIPARKVYFHPSEAGAQDTLLYDFNLNVGDYLAESYNNHVATNQVSEIDSVLVGNEYHKRFWLNYPNAQENYAAIIEGIGSTYGLLYNLVPPFEFRNELVCVKIGLLPVYSNGEMACSLSEIKETEQNLTFSLVPNPVEDISVLRVDPEFEGAKLIVFTETGKDIHRQQIVNQAVEIRKRDFQAGIYFFRIVNEKGQRGTGKFVITD